MHGPGSASLRATARAAASDRLRSGTALLTRRSSSASSGGASANTRRLANGRSSSAPSGVSRSRWRPCCASHKSSLLPTITCFMRGAPGVERNSSFRLSATYVMERCAPPPTLQKSLLASRCQRFPFSPNKRFSAAKRSSSTGTCACRAEWLSPGDVAPPAGQPADEPAPLRLCALSASPGGPGSGAVFLRMATKKPPVSCRCGMKRRQRLSGGGSSARCSSGCACRGHMEGRYCALRAGETAAAWESAYVG
mmetsp:Transcript_36976/g.95903  ORF Transcript_36976/g.95903 Transcript_36976/m.95903 type:complete len:252 (+) Transcript_36976:406-1161(+)